LLRRFFEVDRAHITIAALKALADQEALPAAAVSGAIQKFGIDADSLEPWRA
jgi:pyruvate dehydrogenase E1 component